MHKTMERVKEAIVPEYKSIPMPSYTKAIEGRSITTLFSVAGNIDSYDDQMMPGAFAVTFAQRGSKVLHLWQHDMYSPPIAIVRSLREVGRDALPPEVLEQYPEATGGAEAVSEFLDDERSDAIFKAIKAGSPLQASFGYDPISYDFITQGETRIRRLKEVRLWEVSTVLFGANDATAASKFLMPLEALLKNVEAHLEGKAGARHSTSDIKLLNAIHKAAVALGATSCKGVVEEGEEETEDEKAKSRADTMLIDARELSLTLERAGLFLIGMKA